MPKPTRTPERISHYRAMEAAMRFIRAYFKNEGKKPEIQIPCRPDEDDDIAPIPTSGAVEAAPIDEQLARLKANGGYTIMLTERVGAFGLDFEWVLFYLDDVGQRNLIPLTNKGICWNVTGVKGLAALHTQPPAADGKLRKLARGFIEEMDCAIYELRCVPVGTDMPMTLTQQCMKIEEIERRKKRWQEALAQPASGGGE